MFFENYEEKKRFRNLEKSFDIQSY